MLNRGGWSSHIPRHITAKHPLETNIKIASEWFMSKRLSRECALGPDYIENGVSGETSFTRLSTVDFTELAVHQPGSNSAGIIFTVSSCGKFLMAASGCVIYIYEIDRHHRGNPYKSVKLPGWLRPVTSVIFPSKVLACSMDTSSQRYAIAALMDSRMGLVVDISSNNIDPNSGDENGDAETEDLVRAVDLTTLTLDTGEFSRKSLRTTEARL
jgi:hypothetical protein